MPHHREKYWDRLSQVIRWSNMTTNHFARHIGLLNGENLYQIKRGNNGISQRLAATIVESFPQINISWLLVGEGEMLIEEINNTSSVNYYDVDIEANISSIESLSPLSQLKLPSGVEAELAMPYRGAAMGSVTPTNTILFLREVDMESIVLGEEHLVVSPKFSLLRFVRASTEGESHEELRLVAVERERYDDMAIPRSSVERIYRVVAKLIIN